MSCSENFFKDCVYKELKSSNQQGSGSQETKTKLESILRKNIEEESDQFLDSDDSEDEGQEDLANRLQNIDLNDSAVVWDHLNEKEKADFQDLITSGQIMEFIPKWDPWWMQQANEKLVQDLDVSVPNKTSESHTEIPLLSTLMV